MSPKRKRVVSDDEEVPSDDVVKKGRKKPSHLFTFTVHANAYAFGNVKYRVAQALRAGRLLLSCFLIGLEYGFVDRETIKTVFKKIEMGFSYIRSTGHCHVFIKTQEPFLLPDLREVLVDVLKIPLQDLEKCRSEKSILKYITKEDWHPVVHNIDRDMLHVKWKMRQIVMTSMNLSMFDYRVGSIPFCYKKELSELHTEYWNEMNCFADKGDASPFKRGGLVARLRRETKKGIILYGKSGSSKTSSVLSVIQMPYFMFHQDSNFPMTNYAGEADILIDDCCLNSLLGRHRATMLQLARGYSTAFEVKGGPIKKVRLRGKIYITTNDIPGVLQPEFLNRYALICTD